MRAIKVLVPVSLVVLTGLLIGTTATYAKPEYAKKENQKCVYCHSKVEGKDAMSKNLTDAGKYYKDHDHKLDGYKGK